MKKSFVSMFAVGAAAVLFSSVSFAVPVTLVPYGTYGADGANDTTKTAELTISDTGLNITLPCAHITFSGNVVEAGPDDPTFSVDAVLKDDLLVVGATGTPVKITGSVVKEEEVFGSKVTTTTLINATVTIDGQREPYGTYQFSSAVTSAFEQCQ